MMKRIKSILLGVGALIFSTSAFAVPITVNFSGTIGSHINVWKQSGFNIGDRFTGQYVFESTTNGDRSITNIGGIPTQRMPYPDTILSFTVTSQGNTLTSTGDLQNFIGVDDDLYGRDQYFVVLSSIESELYIDLRSSNTNLFTSQDLPLTIPDVSNFDYSAFFRVRVGGRYASGTIESIQVASASVPAPPVAWLFGFAVVALIGMSRDKKV